MLVKEVYKLMFFLFSFVIIIFVPLEEDAKDKGKLYKPTSKLASLVESFSTKPKAKENKETKESKEKGLLKKEKKKSNLEMFKEELRAYVVN